MVRKQFRGHNQSNTLGIACFVFCDVPMTCALYAACLPRPFSTKKASSKPRTSELNTTHGSWAKRPPGFHICDATMINYKLDFFDFPIMGHKSFRENHKFNLLGITCLLRCVFDMCLVCRMRPFTLLHTTKMRPQRRPMDPQTPQMDPKSTQNGTPNAPRTPKMVTNLLKRHRNSLNKHLLVEPAPNHAAPS